jgi:hypothetical protein
MRITDSNGDVVTVDLIGSGSGAATPGDGAPAELASIDITGADASTSLVIAVDGSGDGRTSVNGIDVTGSMANLLAPDVDLLGDLGVSGALGVLELGDVADPHTITLGSSGDPGETADLSLGAVTDLSVTSAVPIQRLAAASWADTDATPDTVTAPWLRRLDVTGDFETDLVLSGAGDPTWTLYKATVGGTVSGTWDLTGPARAVRVGAWAAGGLTAASLGELTTGLGGASGDWAADLTLTGGAADLTLGSAWVAGTLDGATWQIHGDAGRLDVGTWGAGSTVKLGLTADPAGEFFSGEYDADEGDLARLDVEAHETTGTALFGLVANGLGRATLDGARLDTGLPFTDGRLNLLVRGAQKAMSLPLWTEVDPDLLADSLDALEAAGADWVAVNVFWFQTDVNATEIAPDYDEYSVTDASVEYVIDELHARGFRVMLKPLVDLSDDPGHWRGQIAGSEAWFTGPAGYGAFVNHFAEMAEAHGVDLFCVGTELTNTVAEDARWRAVIADVRARYSGQLTYAANHGGTGSATAADIAWWDALDQIGIDAYYPLTDKNDPTVAELQAAWAERAGMVESWLTGLNVADQKPILFTEIGYRSWDGTNQAPYSCEDKDDTNVDQGEQADCITAVFEEVWKRTGWLQGTYWWNWEVDPNPPWTTANWFPLQDKTAETVLTSYYTGS